MIYLHIPFCRQKCSYCNFHFSTSLAQKDEMLAALKKEILLRANELEDKTLSSLYFGGGTPSLLAPAEIASLMETVLRKFSFDAGIEITLEANPDDLNQKFLKEIHNAGINRLSIGVQSFHDEDLKFMNRAHTGTQAEAAIKRAQDAGFENITMDLIYGSPVSGFEVFQDNLAKTIALGVPHISAYALTVEPNTALGSWVAKGRVPAPEESAQQREFFYLAEMLETQGFEHYEISNFGKPGYHSRHNTAYWQGLPYLGIGPSAHSYDGVAVRSMNISNNSAYIKDLHREKLPLERETLSEKDRYNELMMIGLRTAAGVDLEYLNRNFSAEILEKAAKMVLEKKQSGILIEERGRLRIPESHWFLADGIAADLFLI